MMNGKWLAWKAMRRGSRHAQAGIPNQDAVAVRLRPERAICVVADGVGSEPLSHFGSHALCRVACSCLADGGELTEARLEMLHRKWLEALPKNNPPARFSTTCRLLLAEGDSLFLAHVGDGGTMVLGRSCFVSMGSSEEHSFLNVTSALAAQAPSWHIEKLDLHDVVAVFLMTDGLYDDIPESNQEAFAHGLADAYRGCSRRHIHRDALAWMRGWPAGPHTDDMSIAALMRKE